MLKLLPTLESRKDKLRFVLGSASPRRLELLKTNLLGQEILVEQVPSDFQEDYDKTLYVGKAKEYVSEYAVNKAHDVEAKILKDHLNSIGKNEVLILGSDTVVVQDGRILEKPRDKDEAIAMLKSYSGKTQSVVTGVAMVHLKLDSNDKSIATERKEIVSTCETVVHFGPIDHGLAEAYVQTGEPMDKAGGFGMQGLGATLITGIEGCYFNVVGLPIYLVGQELCALLEQQSKNENRLPYLLFTNSNENSQRRS